MRAVRKVIQIKLENVVERRMNRFLPHFRSPRDFPLVGVNCADDGVRITLIVLARQVLTCFEPHLNALILVVGVCVRNAKKVARGLLMKIMMVQVVVADDGHVLLAVGARRNRTLGGMKELWWFVVGGRRQQSRRRVIVASRLKVFFAVVVVVTDNLHFNVRHSLHFRVIVDWPQRKPMILVIVQMQVTFPYCDLSNRFVLLKMSITFQHVHRQVSKFTWNLEREFFTKERRLVALRLCPTNLLLIEGDSTVDIAIGCWSGTTSEILRFTWKRDKR